MDETMNAKRSENPRLLCPRCGQHDIWRNGTSRAGKQQYRCRHCNRIFVTEPYISQSIKEIADRLLSHDIEVPIAARILKGYVSRRWLYSRKEKVNV